MPLRVLDFPVTRQEIAEVSGTTFHAQDAGALSAELLRMADLLGAGAGNLRPALFSDENQPGDPTVASGKCRSRKQ